MYLLASCTSSFENFLFNSCAHFFILILILLRVEFFEFPVGLDTFSNLIAKCMYQIHQNVLTFKYVHLCVSIVFIKA
jgi:hypothetical protein